MSSSHTTQPVPPAGAALAGRHGHHHKPHEQVRYVVTVHTVPPQTFRFETEADALAKVASVGGAYATTYQLEKVQPSGATPA